MSKKWKNINELIMHVVKDSTLLTCYKNLKCITYAPNIGYRCWIFKYKGTPVVLGDLGNGHYDFHSAATWWDVLMTKLTVWYDCWTSR